MSLSTPRALVRNIPLLTLDFIFFGFVANKHHLLKFRFDDSRIYSLDQVKTYYPRLLCFVSEINQVKSTNLQYIKLLYPHVPFKQILTSQQHFHHPFPPKKWGICLSGSTEQPQVSQTVMRIQEAHPPQCHVSRKKFAGLMIRGYNTPGI